MKTKTTLIHCFLPVALTGLLLTLSAHAKNEKPWVEFEKTEERYDDLSKKYKKMAEDVGGEKGELLTKLSGNYDKMADIKKDAAKGMKKGKMDEFDWSGYEKLSQENYEIESKLGFTKPDHGKKHPKPDFKDKGKHKDKEKHLEELEKLLDEKDRLIEEKKKLLEED